MDADEIVPAQCQSVTIGDIWNYAEKHIEAGDDIHQQLGIKLIVRENSELREVGIFSAANVSRVRKPEWRTCAQAF